MNRAQLLDRALWSVGLAVLAWLLVFTAAYFTLHSLGVEPIPRLHLDVEHEPPGRSHWSVTSLPPACSVLVAALVWKDRAKRAQ